MKYRFMGKEKRLALGVYPSVSLQEARDKRMLAKKQLEQGQDPAEIKKIAKLEQQTEYENSFENIAREWHQQKIHTWKTNAIHCLFARHVITDLFILFPSHFLFLGTVLGGEV